MLMWCVNWSQAVSNPFTCTLQPITKDFKNGKLEGSAPGLELDPLSSIPSTCELNPTKIEINNRPKITVFSGDHKGALHNRIVYHKGLASQLRDC